MELTQTQHEPGATSATRTLAGDSGVSEVVVQAEALSALAL